jgi:16S rRNA G966 N2-methylase RsmD
MIDTVTAVSRQLAKNRKVFGLIGTRYGLRGAMTLLFEDVLFDVRHRTDTIWPVHNSDLFAQSEIKERQRYLPTPFVVVRESLRLLATHTPLSNVNFIDLGCGKGKVLFEAAKFPFAKIKGVEYSRALYDIAERNVEKLGLQHRIELFCTDAMHWRPSEDDRVYFLCNPFSGKVLSKVLDNICAATPPGSKTSVIYGNPVHDEMFTQRMKCLTRTVVDPGIRVNFYEFEPGRG